MDKCKRQADQPETVRISAYVDIVGEGMTCQKCGSENIMADVEYDGGHRRPYLKCLMCGREYKNALSNNDNPVIDKQENTEPAFETIEESEEKMETIEEKPVKQKKRPEANGHSSCLNHPDKYAWKNGLCYKCNAEIYRKKGLSIPDGPDKPDMIRSTPEIAQRLKQRIKELSMPVKELRIKSGTSSAQIWRIRHEQQIGIAVWNRISAALGVTTDWLINGGNDNNINLVQEDATVMDEGIVVKSCADCRYYDVPNGPEKWGQVDGKPFGNVNPVHLIAVRESETWAYEIREHCASIIFGEHCASIILDADGKFKSCKVKNIDSERFTYSTWVFLGRVGREIERLAKK